MSIHPAKSEPTTQLSLRLLADALRLEYGAAKSLGYGLGAPQMSLEQRQQELLQQLQDTVLNSMRSGGTRLCLVGPSLASMVAALRADGHECVWIHGSECADGGGESVSGDFLQQSLEPGFDAIVLEGSIQYTRQLHMLQWARAGLGAGGLLLLLGEYLLDDSRIRFSSLANLSSCRQLGERLGFTLQSEQALDQDAMLSLEQYAVLLQNRRQDLLAQGEYSATRLDNELEALSNIKAELEQGRRCLRMLEMVKSPVTDSEYALAEYGDINSFAPIEIAELFARSFNTEFDAAIWDWKYRLGAGRCVVARQQADGDIVAHYGGAPRAIRYFGEETLAIQVCDVMVMPEVRRHYGRRSLFFKTAATFLEREIGNTVGHLLGFGFPNQKAMNIAKRLGLYEKTDDFVELVYVQPEITSGLGTVEGFDVETSSHAEALQQLWQGMAEDFRSSIIGERDQRYFRYRYVQHPAWQRGEYQHLLLRDEAGTATAVAVLKKHGEQQLLLDIITPLVGMRDALDSLIRHVWGQEQKQLKCWITRAWLETIRQPGAIVNELGIEIPCNSWNPGPAAETLHGQWWLTAGDMDFM